MNRYYFRVILLFCSTCVVKGWINYRFSFLVSKIRYVDTEYAKLYNFDVLKKNRTYTYLYLNMTMLKPIDNVTLTIRISKFANNRYKDAMAEFKTDVCELISTKPLSKTDGFSANLFAKLKDPLHQMWNGPGQKFFQECPIVEGNYYSRMHFDEETIPVYFWPKGRWKVDLDFFRAKKDWAKLSFDFDLSTYLTEKQRSKG